MPSGADAVMWPVTESPAWLARDAFCTAEITGSESPKPASLLKSSDAVSLSPSASVIVVVAKRMSGASSNTSVPAGCASVASSVTVTTPVLASTAMLNASVPPAVRPTTLPLPMR